MKKYIGMTFEQYQAIREEENKKETKPEPEFNPLEDIIFEYGFGYSNKIL